MDAYIIPDEAGEGDRVEHIFTARFILADYTEHTVIRGKVSTPRVLGKDNPYREGAVLSDGHGRLRGWLAQQLPTPSTTLPGSWNIHLD
jgi:hypothetical protein